MEMGCVFDSRKFSLLTFIHIPSVLHVANKGTRVASISQV